ncbi:MAG TPA: sce7726 family protein, partial [Longimicrobium sp.]
MRDHDIRQALHASELNAHREEPDTLVLDELGICQGDFRVDIAVVNGSLHGIEIKSDRDTLNRLPLQAEAYSRVFDTMCIVAGSTHISRIAAMVPDWWTLRVAVGGPGGVTFKDVRHGANNQDVDSAA